MSHIEQDFDGAVQFVCDCNAHMVIKAYTTKTCPKCDTLWYYDYDVKEVYATTSRNTFQSFDKQTKTIHKDRAVNKRHYERI